MARMAGSVVACSLYYYDYHCTCRVCKSKMGREESRGIDKQQKAEYQYLILYSTTVLQYY